MSATESFIERKFGFCEITWDIENFCFAPKEQDWTFNSEDFCVRGSKVTKWKMGLRRAYRPDNCYAVEFTLKRLKCQTEVDSEKVRAECFVQCFDVGVTGNAERFNVKYTTEVDFERIVPIGPLLTKSRSSHYGTYRIRCVMFVTCRASLGGFLQATVCSVNYPVDVPMQPTLPSYESDKHRFFTTVRVDEFRWSWTIRNFFGRRGKCICSSVMSNDDGDMKFHLKVFPSKTYLSDRNYPYTSVHLYVTTKVQRELCYDISIDADQHAFRCGHDILRGQRDFGGKLLGSRDLEGLLKDGSLTVFLRFRYADVNKYEENLRSERTDYESGF